MVRIEDHSKASRVGSVPLAQYRRVCLTDGALRYAGSYDADSIGTLARDVDAGGAALVLDPITSGTRIMICAEPISAGSEVYAAAEGKVSRQGTVLVGAVFTGSDYADEQVEVVPW